MAIDPVSLGIQVALMAAQMALGASRKIEGPRLDDLSVSLADYGTPLNYLRGACRFDGCPIFWKMDFTEIRVKSKGKGGKYSDYRYEGSWANLIAAQEILGVTRIRADRHLIYDRTGVGPVTPFSIGYSQRSGKTGSRDVNINLLDHLRIYLGTETQDPDPFMLQEVEARKGAGFCPAHRGSAYAIFERLPLDKFGNRLPQMSFDAVSAATDVFPFEVFETIAGQPNRLWGFTFSPDFSRMMWANTSSYEIWDVAARTRMVAGVFPENVNLSHKLGLYDDGTILVVTATNDQILRLTPEGLGISSVVLTIGDSDNWQQEARMLKDGDGDEHWASIPWSINEPFYFDGVLYEMVDLTGVIWPPRGFFTDRYGDIWAVGQTPGLMSTTLHFYRMVSSGDSPHSDRFFSITGLTPVVSQIPNIEAVHYLDDSRDQFVVLWGDKAIYVIDIATQAVTESIVGGISVYNPPKQFANCPPGAATLWLDEDEISLADLTTVRSVDMADWLTNDADGIIFDPINHALITAPQFDQEICWRYLDRISGGGVTLRDVVEHVSEISGIDAGILDATALTQSVAGYKWTRGSGKDIIEPLLDLHAADCRPHGFSVQFVNRGAASGAEISSEDFAMLDGDEPLYGFTTQGGTDVPTGLTLAFSDIESEYQTNNIRSMRPLDAVDARGEVSVDMTPLSIAPGEARPLADRLLRHYWISRKGWTHSLTSEYIDLEPGNVRTLDLEGVVHTAKLLSMAVDADGAIAIEWQRDDPSVHVLNDEPGADMDGHEDSVILIPGLVKGVVIDAPLASDAHDSSVPFLYLAAAPYADGVYFPGVDFAISDTGIFNDYEPGWAVVPSGGAMDWGIATAVLGDALPWLFDWGQTLHVRLQMGTLISSTEDAILNDSGLNLLLVRSGAGWEYLQFVTATLQGDGSYNVTGLLRGLRGTEQFISGHAAGDMVIVVDSQVLRRDVGAAEIGDTDSYRPVVQGRIFESAFEQSLTFTAAANRPYSPVHGLLLRDTGTDDWTISATRRTRIGGANVDGGDVPLGEVSEAWQADIMDGADVVRTLLGTTLPLTYLAADQVTDFGVEQSTLDVNLYQMSPALSLRGFPLSLAA